MTNIIQDDSSFIVEEGAGNLNYLSGVGQPSAVLVKPGHLVVGEKQFTRTSTRPFTRDTGDWHPVKDPSHVKEAAVLSSSLLCPFEQVGVAVVESVNGDSVGMFGGTSGATREFDAFVRYLLDDADRELVPDADGKQYSAAVPVPGLRPITVHLHVNRLLSPEQHRSLIGNDFTVCLFRDTQAHGPLRLSELNQLGTVCSFFVIVSPAAPATGLYNCTFVRRSHIRRDSESVLRSTDDKSFEISRSLLLSTIVVNQIDGLFNPPWSRLLFKHREASICDFVDKVLRVERANDTWPKQNWKYLTSLVGLSFFIYYTWRYWQND